MKEKIKNKNTCDGCYHIMFDSDKITMRCDIDNEIISKRRPKCDAYSRDESEKYIG